MKSSNEEIFDILVKHIIKIFDENDNEVKFSKLQIVFEKRKFSSSKSKNLYIDDIPLNTYQRRSYKVIYKCRCNRENKILLHKYINKQKLVCQHCLQNRSFDDSVYTAPYSLKHGIRIKTKKNIKVFDDYDDEFKKHYKDKHLTEKEFYKYLPYFYRINNTIIKDIGKNYETLVTVYLKCSVCNKIFKIHIENIRNKDLTNIKCKTCGLNNHRYEIKLFDESGLTYQSNLEKYFIEQCYKHNIKINNGLHIPYYFNNTYHTYVSDFYLPEYKYVIEIKSNNIWYRRDLNSGKLQAKENATNEFGKKLNIKYKLLFDQDIDVFIKNILDERDSLNN